MITHPLTDSAAAPPRLALVWRIAIMFAAVTLGWLLISAAITALLGADYTRASHAARAITTTVVMVPLVIVARRFLDQRSWGGLALGTLREGWRPLLVGVVCWLVPAALALGLGVLLGWFELTPRYPLGDIAAFSAGLVVLVFLYEALPEELIFRGYFYRNLAEAMPRRWAVLGQALLFTLWGFLNGGENSLERTAIFFTASLIIGVFRVVTGSVWASIGVHLAFQTVAQLFGPIGDQFVVGNLQQLMLFAFGVLPFSLCLPLLRWFYPNRPAWDAPEPDTSVRAG